MTSASYQQRVMSPEERRRNGLPPIAAPASPAPAPRTIKGAVKVDAFPQQGKYPFAEIAADGGIWRLDPAVFKVKPATLKQAAYTWAGREGYSVKSVLVDGALYVQFKRLPEGTSTEAARRAVLAGVTS